MPDKFTDILTYALSLALAGAVIAFAAYKVVALNGMENPPANLGLNFPAAKRKVIMQDGVGDPLTTQSLGPATRSGPRSDKSEGPYVYELLAVVDGVAFVAVDGDTDRTLVPVTIGSTLPGGLTVSAIRRRDGHWWLAAGNLTLEQSGPAPQ
jgi:hypothetical protein